MLAGDLIDEAGDLLPAGCLAAVYGAHAGTGTALGPLLGGVLLTASIGGLSWQPIFFLNVPIGVLTLLAAWRLLPESIGQGGNLDPVGIALPAGRGPGERSWPPSTSRGPT